MATTITFETTLDSGKCDTKGRRIGYTVAFGENENGLVYAFVQNARYNSKKREWKNFGVAQRGKGFKTQEEATKYAYATAKRRIATLADTCRILAK